MRDSSRNDLRTTNQELNRIDVLVANSEARELLASAGVRVQDNRVYIPAHIIQDAIASTPRAFTVWGRDGQHAMHGASGVRFARNEFA